MITQYSNQLFIQLAIVLGLSAVLGYLVKKLKLPPLVAYMLVGVLLSFLKLINPVNSEVLTTFPSIGIAFVLFFIGMELDLKEIKSLGKPILFAGLGQIIVANLFGFIVASLLGFASGEAAFLGVGLAFSSTIVVIKLLLEKKDLGSLYGKLSIGILLLEDLVAIMILMGMSVGGSIFHSGLQNSLPLLLLLGKGIFLFVLALGLSRFVLGRVFRAVASSSELLFLSALSWCFIFVSIAILLGFSVVIGAFLAGVALANSPFHLEIAGKVKPLRDFFVTLFFVYLGSQVVFQNIMDVLPLILIFTLYALVIKPVILLLILGSFGFRRHTIFQTAVNLSQISEFSLIIMLVGLNLGVVSQASLTAMALTGVLSIIASSTMISFSRKLYRHIQFLVGFFERASYVHHVENKNKGLLLEDHVIIVGGHRIGGEVIKFLKREKIPFLVLDFNPKVVQRLVDQKVHVLYGDLGDPEIVDFLNLESARLIISTATDLDDNLMLLAEVKRRKLSTVVIARALSSLDAKHLYEAGAEYVILPEVITGDFITEMLKTHWSELSYFKSRSEIELNRLTQQLVLE